MAIGTASIIPLNRIAADPSARFQRFGQNDSQLFGKSLDLAPQTQVTQMARLSSQPQETQASDQVTPAGHVPLAGQSGLTASVPPSTAWTYAGRSISAAGSGSTPKPGSYLNVKA